ncbi:unnamed protein product [Caenorhabditis auriculariae]|uniref:TPR_REGION domain-containing protein n=1 Tax=Caenorhabditis auriculariae TaxID=2777116 RepID=A0A8S1H4M6_9PELO|nr:unnamed protein product [Caenorhabditis auriculariae]
MDLHVRYDAERQQRFFSIPLNGPHEDGDGNHLKSLQRFSIEVWNLTQNWGDASTKAAQSVEKLVNSRLQVMYARDGSSEATTSVPKSEEKKRCLMEIVKENRSLGTVLDNLNAIIGKFRSALNRMPAWKQLTANSAQPEVRYIVDTLTEVLPSVVAMYQKELDAKKAALLDFGQCESRQEVIEINVDDLPSGDEVMGILQAEQAKLVYWIHVAIQYYRAGRFAEFLNILESAGSQAFLDYPNVQNDQMRALDMLAAHHMQQGAHEKSKERRTELFNKATVLFNTADKIKMYDMVHLTIRAWFYLFEKEKSKLEIADQQFNFVIKQEATMVLAMIGKAVIAFTKRDYKTAIYFYRRALRAKSADTPEIRVGLAYCFAKIGKPDKAEMAFERARDLDPNCIEALAGLAILRENLQDENSIKAALDLLSEAFRVKSDHPLVLVQLANHFFYKKDYVRVEQLAWHALQKNFEKAFKYYYQSTQLNYGDLTLSFYGLGQMYIQRKEWDKAIDCFETVLTRIPNNADTLKVLGSLYAHTNPDEAKLQKARETLQKALDLKPDDVELLIDLAQLLEATDPNKSLELYERSIEMLKELEDIDPPAGNGQQRRRLIYFEQARDRYQEMLALGEKVEEDRHQLITIRYNLARCLEHLCQSNDAEAMYKDILNEMPTYIDCYMRLGCLTRDRGQIYDSSVWFKQAIPYDNGSMDAWTLIGNLHMAKQEWQPAQKKFEHILNKITSGKHDPYSLIALGNVWLEQLMNPNRKREDEKKYVERATQMYIKALKIQPKNIYAANGLGCVMAFKKNWAEARDVFSQVREATSEFFDVWINIAHVYMEREQYVPAIQMYSNAMKKFHRQSDPHMLLYLAKAYYHADKLEEAKDTMEKAILESPENLQFKFNYAFLLKRRARAVLKGAKVTSGEVNGAIEDLQSAERALTYISKNEDLSLPGAKYISRTMCGQEANDCKDLLVQANTALERAQQLDEEERRVKAKQEEERLLLKKKMEEEMNRKEEEIRRKLEEAKALRSKFVEMTKDVLRLPEINDDKKVSRSGRKKKVGGDGEEFVNDSSDMGDWRGEEDGEPRERKKKDKASKKASRKRRERRDGSQEGSGSDDDRAERKRRKKEAAERRKAEAKLSAKQSAKIKSRAFLSSSEGSSDEGEKVQSSAKSDDDEPKTTRDEFEDSPEPPRIGDSDDSDDESDKEVAKPKRKKPVMDSDDSSGSEGRPIIGASSDEDEPSTSQGKKRRQADSDEDEDDDGEESDEQPSAKRKKKTVVEEEDEEESGNDSDQSSNGESD